MPGKDFFLIRSSHLAGAFRNLAKKCAKYQRFFPPATLPAFTWIWFPIGRIPLEVVNAAAEPPTWVNRPETWAQLPDFASRMMFVDLVSYLPDDILVKLDRASMGVSLESRVPYLDDLRMVEFAWRLPMHMKIRGGQRKWLLRQVLYRYVPEKMVERPKKGFGIPIDAWLKGPLRAWAEALLDVHRLKDEGLLNPMPIQQKWQEHLAGKHNWQYHLWDILMFQSWLEANR